MVDIQDEIYAELQKVAQARQCSFGQALSDSLRRLFGLSQEHDDLPPLPPEPCGYRIPFSPGERSFTSEDARRIEDDDVFRDLNDDMFHNPV